MIRDPHVLGALWITSTSLEEIGDFGGSRSGSPDHRSWITDRESFGVVRFYIVVTGNLVSMVQRSFNLRLN